MNTLGHVLLWVSVTLIVSGAAGLAIPPLLFGPRREVPRGN